MTGETTLVQIQSRSVIDSPSCKLNDKHLISLLSDKIIKLVFKMPNLVLSIVPASTHAHTGNLEHLSPGNGKISVLVISSICLRIIESQLTYCC